MPLNPNYSVSVLGRDRSGEPTRYSLPQDAMYDVTTWQLGNEVYDFVMEAVASVCDGILTGINAVDTRKFSNAAHATDGNREDKWLVTYYDEDTFGIFFMELPCRKATVRPPVGTDDVDLLVEPWVSFRAKFEAGGIASPDGGNVVLSKVTLVGRNS